MASLDGSPNHLANSFTPPKRPSIVVGVSNAQTCIVLGGRLGSLREAGFNVTFISSPSKESQRFVEGERVRMIPIQICRQATPMRDLLSLIRLCKTLATLRPDITEFSTPKAGLLGNLASFLCQVPSRVYVLRGLRFETESGLKRTLLLAAERVACACASTIICNSKSLLESALAFKIAPASKLAILGKGSSRGVDVEQFSPGPDVLRSSLGLPREAKVVGYVGRLTLHKGIPELIAAFDMILRRQPDAWLLLVGWFDESEDSIDEVLQNQILHHPRIIFTGRVDDTAPYYRAMDLLVLPSWREGFPNVVIEASATAIPVIATQVTGSRDAVETEITGLLIPPGRPIAIQEAVINLLRDPERRRRMGQAGRRFVLDHYMDRQVARLTIAFYKSLLSHGYERSEATAHSSSTG